jgi:hypothetical protein
VKSLRKIHPLLFDLTLFILFTLGSFAALFLTDAAGSTGAAASILFLSLISIVLIISR